MKWEWQLIDIDPGRAKRAAKIRLSNVEVNGQKASADVVDEKTGEIVYECTLSKCSCEDFHMNTRGRKPCKHILALGMAVGVINKDGYTPDQQLTLDIAALRDRIATASGFYHVFHEPTVSDSAYDAMKQELARLQAEREAMP